MRRKKTRARHASDLRRLLIVGRNAGKQGLFYRTLNGPQVGDLFMSLIHTCQLSGVLVNTLHAIEPADEPPAAGQLAHSKHQFVSAFFQRQVYGIVFRIHDAKKSGVSEALRTSATIEDSVVQKKADVVAIADVELFDLIPVREERRTSIDHLHSLLRL